MDYKEQIEQAKRAAVKWREKHPVIGVGEIRVDCMVDDLTRSITDLLARCDRLEEARENANEACAKWEGMYHMTLERAEKAEIVDRLGVIEDILGDEYELDRLCELARADKLIGKTVWLTKWFTKNVQIANPPLQRTIIYISVCKMGKF